MLGLAQKESDYATVFSEMKSVLKGIPAAQEVMQDNGFMDNFKEAVTSK